MVSKWIKENILDKDIGNIRFFAKMGKIDFIFPWGVAVTSGDKNTWVECKIDERRYKVKDGYKITLLSLDERYTYDHYYQSDFESLVKDGFIVIKTKGTEYVEHVKWLEPLTNTVSVIHEADIVIA